MTTTDPRPAPPVADPGEEPGSAARGESVALPGGQRPWREVAAQLYEALRKTGVFCGKHSVTRPDDDCPWCEAAAALNVYRAACMAADGEGP